MSKKYFGSSEGLSMLDENPSDPTEGTVTTITTSYNSGIQRGDIKTCLMADTESGTVGDTELVTNGTFDTDISGWDAVAGSVNTWDSGTIKIKPVTYSGALQHISVKLGSTYLISVEVTATTVGTGRLYIGTPSGTSKYYNSSGLGVGVHTYIITAINTILQIILAVKSSGTDDINYDNISVKEVIPDRSVAGNHAQVIGSLTKSAVSSGAELMAFSGFSTSNYTEIDDASMVSTAYLTGWQKDSGVWKFVHGLISDNPMDGVSLSGQVLHIEGTMDKALLHVSATTPTAAQLEEKRIAELPMFQENAKCTLSGSSNSVLALSYDDSKNEATVITDVVDTFNGLVNVKQASLTGTGQCVDSGNGVVAIGTSTQASVEKPEINVREELAKQPQRSFIPEQFWFTGDGSETDFDLPAGYDVWAVYSAGLLQKEGSSDEYEIEDNGSNKTVTFNTAPASGADICIMGVIS